jgi:hypothetical protein
MAGVSDIPIQELQGNRRVNNLASHNKEDSACRPKNVNIRGYLNAYTMPRAVESRFPLVLTSGGLGINTVPWPKIAFFGVHFILEDLTYQT